MSAPEQLPLLPELTMRTAAEIPAPANPVSDGGEWDWHDPSDRADLVVEEQPATAIYPNPRGTLISRQRLPDPCEDDAFVYVRPEFAPAIIARLADLAGLTVTICAAGKSK